MELKSEPSRISGDVVQEEAAESCINVPHRVELHSEQVARPNHVETVATPILDPYFFS